jgi:hypothetical protein
VHQHLTNAASYDILSIISDSCCLLTISRVKRVIVCFIRFNIIAPVACRRWQDDTDSSIQGGEGEVERLIEAGYFFVFVPFLVVPRVEQ